MPRLGTFAVHACPCLSFESLATSPGDAADFGHVASHSAACQPQRGSCFCHAARTRTTSSSTSRAASLAIQGKPVHCCACLPVFATAMSGAQASVRYSRVHFNDRRDFENFDGPWDVEASTTGPAAEVSVALEAIFEHSRGFWADPSVQSMCSHTIAFMFMFHDATRSPNLPANPLLHAVTRLLAAWQAMDIRIRQRMLSLSTSKPPRRSAFAVRLLQELKQVRRYVALVYETSLSRSRPGTRHAPAGGG